MPGVSKLRRQPLPGAGEGGITPHEEFRRLATVSQPRLAVRQIDDRSDLQICRLTKCGLCTTTYSARPVLGDDGLGGPP
jgi:hypothetical protein